MKQLIGKLLDMGLEQFANNSRQKLVLTDEVYLRDKEDEEKLEQRYMDLDLPDNHRMFIDDYIACLKTCADRYSDISYVSGLKDAVKMCTYLGLLKDFDISEEI